MFSFQFCDFLLKINRIEWNATDLNTEQKSAIVNILKQTSYPHPYLLFGPPGTGKTKTLIEAIMQIIHNDNPNEFILVCATSNSACNEVAMRLLASIGTDKLFRIFAKSVCFKMADIPDVLLTASNLQKGEHYYPSLQVIYQYKVTSDLELKNLKWISNQQVFFGILSGHCLHINNSRQIITG